MHIIMVIHQNTISVGSIPFCHCCYYSSQLVTFHSLSPKQNPLHLSPVSAHFSSQLSIKKLGSHIHFLPPPQWPCHKTLIPVDSAFTTALFPASLLYSHSPDLVQTLVIQLLRQSHVSSPFQQSAHPPHWCQICSILTIPSVPYLNP